MKEKINFAECMKRKCDSVSIIRVVLKRRGKRMKFRINNTEWIIKVVDEATINNEMKRDGILGITIYKTKEIMLLESQANIIKTLKHELMHCWLYEYGHAQNDNTTYDYEDICEIVASSNDFINDIVKQYMLSGMSRG